MTAAGCHVSNYCCSRIRPVGLLWHLCAQRDLLAIAVFLISYAIRSHGVCGADDVLWTQIWTFIGGIVDVSCETDTVATPSDIRVNQLEHLSESLERFKPPRNRQRKRRTIFSPAATHLLEHEFASDCYPDNGRLQQLAQLIGHTDIAAIQVSLGLQKKQSVLRIC